MLRRLHLDLSWDQELMPATGIAQQNQSADVDSREITSGRNSTMTSSTTIQESTFTDTFVREVRATYLTTSSPQFVIQGPEEAAEFVRSVLTDNSREHFVALYLDGASQVACYSIVSIGTANASMVHPREVFQRAVLAGAISIIVAHNHPSGNLTPSSADEEITKRLKSAGDILGIKLLDHLIVSDQSFFSLCA